MRTKARGLLAVTLLWGCAHLATNPASAARGGVSAERNGADDNQPGDDKGGRGRGADDAVNDTRGNGGNDDPPGHDSKGADDNNPGDDKGGNRGGNNNQNRNAPSAPRNRAGILKFDQRSFEFREPVGRATIVVERSKGERGAVSVEYVASAGTATAGDDFTAVRGTLSWGAGDGLRKTFVIPIHEDSLSEGNETIRLALRNATGGAAIDAARGQSLAVILDNDGSLASCGSSANSGCVAGRLEVTLDWRGSQNEARDGRPAQLSANSVAFGLSSADAEVLVKSANRCASYGTFEIEIGATSREAFLVTVTDTWTGLVKQFGSAGGQAPAPVADARTFRCDD
jgi:hypothetical protein